MVKVITVEREYGSQGAEFAHRLANRLNWKLIDRCLIDEIAHKAGVPTSMAEHCDERLDPWYHMVGKSFWHGSVDRMPAPPKDQVFDSERMVEFVRNYLKQCSVDGNCFNIFVYASMARKIRWLEEHFPEQAGHARAEIEATDSRRESYVRRYYDRDWTDRRLYHMMINSCMGCDAMIQAVMDGAGMAAVREQAAVSSQGGRG